MSENGETVKMAKRSFGRTRSWSTDRGSPMSSSIVTAVAVALLLSIVAGAARSGLVASGQGTGAAAVPALPDLFYYVIAAIEILGIVALAMLGGLSRRKDDDQLERFQPRAPWWSKALALVLVVALLATIAVSIGHLTQPTPPSRDAGTLQQSEAEARPSSQSAPSHRGPATSPTLGVIVTGVLLIIVLSLLVGLALMPRPERDVQPEGLRAHLIREADAGLVDLESIADPRRAVIACYARMQRAIEAAGIRRRRSDTPVELLRRSLADERLPKGSIARLTDLFQRAKFSSHRIDDAMRRSALLALRHIRAALEERP